VLEIIIDKERCVACGDCASMCPQSGPAVEFPVLEAVAGGEVFIKRAEACIACFTCVEFCRSAAITIVGADPGGEEQPPIYPSRLVTRII